MGASAGLGIKELSEEDSLALVSIMLDEEKQRACDLLQHDVYLDRHRKNIDH